MEAPVRISELSALNGKRIGKIELNSPGTLNALSLEMVDLITPALKRWEYDGDIACVFLCGSGAKAFCAGGDIRSLYEGMTGQRSPSFCQDFFCREYEMDFHIHQYTKPLICWGSGFVIGGGIGIMSGCRYRIVTETSKLSMPEVSIGLYPDVAGSWFFNRMPGKIGLFLALTGAALNPRDSILMGLADYYLSTQQQSALLEALVQADWSDSSSDNHQQVHAIIECLQCEHIEPLPDSQVLQHFNEINRCLGGADLAENLSKLLDYACPDAWLEKAQTALSKGSPSSLSIIDRQLNLSRFYSLAEVYRSELTLSMNCADDGEFAEGIRALLIDKDLSPQWRYKTVSAVEPDWLDKMFTQRWDSLSHPLRELGIR